MSSNPLIRELAEPLHKVAAVEVTKSKQRLEFCPLIILIEPPPPETAKNMSCVPELPVIDWVFSG